MTTDTPQPFLDPDGRDKRVATLALLARLAAAAPWPVGTRPTADPGVRELLVETPEGLLAWTYRAEDHALFAPLQELRADTPAVSGAQTTARLRAVVAKLDALHAQLAGRD